MRILLLTPPMTQINTPYPATPYLTGFLRERGYDVAQADPAIELVLRLLSRPVSRRLTAYFPKDFLRASAPPLDTAFS